MSTKLTELLKKYLGTWDVTEINFRDIDEKTSLTKLNYKKTIGNNRLFNGKIKTPEKLSRAIEQFLLEPIP